ncbi:hypothetical protein CTI12_AA301130 [Artemisia annua]|uniref:COI1 F-box domain-containing protein n=1 Tax=Artemisia annua TaxID=35608 RepID=A0A2U1N6R1_ARTAN|nr:hypothetical protein CTI12_AA301130 [Artemisia annua]
MSPTYSTDELFDCIIPYIHQNDRNSVSLVSRKLYELDSLTRKHVTLRNCYSVPPSRLVTRFPNLESLTLVGRPNKACVPVAWGGIVDDWVAVMIKSLKRLECVRFKRMIVFNEDLERLAGMCGERIKVLRIEGCAGFSTDGLLHIGKKCSGLRVLSLEKSLIVDKDGEWLRELAERSKGIETLNLFMTYLSKYDCGDFVKIAKNCGGSLVCLRIGNCHLKYVADIFRYGVKLEDFSSDPYIEEGEEEFDVKYPPTMRSVAFLHGIQQDIPVIQSFAHQLTKFDLRFSTFNADDHCAIIYLCPNLEVLYTRDTIEDLGLQFVGHICKKLRRIKVEKSGQVGLVSDVGLLALAKGCLELESLHITIKDIQNVVLEFIGANLKNLLDFGLVLHNKEEPVSDLPLDNGICALLKGCTKLEKLSIHLRPGGLTDLGCGYIGKYGQNLRYMNLGFCPESDAGLVELSKGCPKLQKFEVSGCDFSQQALVTFVLNVTSLRYLWVEDYHAFKCGHDLFAMVRPFWKMELITYEPNVANAPEGATQQKPTSLLAYYSLAEQRNDFPKSVIPLYPFVEFD